jgi:ComF family protein
VSPPLATIATRLLVDPLLAVVFPSSCPVCLVPLAHPSSGPLCEACWNALPRHLSPLCGCGLPLPRGASETCARCRRGLSPFERGASLGPYEGSLKAAIHELKFRGRRRVAGRLAQALLEERPVSQLLSAEVVLVPVPLHPRRARERGFNQSELLALEIARRRGLASAADVLVRRRDTSSQTGLSAAQRRRNVRGAFLVRRRARVAGRSVVLVDDVITTGATAIECARVLREAGAKEVRLLAAARVA